jgi:predicted lysophospholipase L1 biosynthesis ABC-type transport system permease subunit
MEDLTGMKEAAPEAGESKWEQNKYSIYADLGLGALFFIVSKVTGDLVLAAIVGGVTGLGLIVLQRFVKVDLWAVLPCLAPSCWPSPRLFLSFYKIAIGYK